MIRLRNYTHTPCTDRRKPSLVGPVLVMFASLAALVLLAWMHCYTWDAADWVMVWVLVGLFVWAADRLVILGGNPS